LIPPGCTTITAGEINKRFAAPIPTQMIITLADSELSWSELSTTITIAVKDQYGNRAAVPGGGWQFTMTWTKGNGTLSYDGFSTTEAASFVVHYSGATDAIVTYTRNKTSGDLSPIFTITELNALLGSAITRIQLLDSGGNQIP
jgi:hypothetical protein